MNTKNKNYIYSKWGLDRWKRPDGSDPTKGKSPQMLYLFIVKHITGFQ